MKVSQRNLQFGFARWVILGGLGGLLLVIAVVIVQSLPSKAVRKKQEALVQGVEKRSAARIRRLLSEDYSDRWGFTPEDATDALLDGGSQFLVLVVTEEELDFQQDGKTVEVTAQWTLSGKPIGPAAQEIMRRINQLESPFVFTWRKESFAPTSWRLLSIENEGLPQDLYGYEPGDIRRAMKGE